MTSVMGVGWCLAFALMATSSAGAGANGAAVEAPSESTEHADAPDCSTWTLDGYRIGMRGEELLAIRSVTLHTEGQAEANQPGKFHGVLVLDALNRLEKWSVVYETSRGDGIRAEVRERLGKPTSDINGNVAEGHPEAGRQRRTIWWSRTCDVALIVYEHSGPQDTPDHSVSATLARASNLPQGLAQMKTLFP